MADSANHHGTFHLSLNFSITRDHENVEYLVKEWERDPQMNHTFLSTARRLLVVTANACLPRKKLAVKNDLEKLYTECPNSINTIANLACIYNSLLLMTQFEKMQKKLEDVVADSSKLGVWRRAQALAERAFILIGDVASQEQSDDVDKLKLAISWFEKAISEFQHATQNESNENERNEIIVWTFYLAKANFRLENRYRHESVDVSHEDRKKNYGDMLERFAEVFLNSGPSLAVFKAMSLVYPAEIFTSSRELPKLPAVYLSNSELQSYHVDPVKGCNAALNILDTYSIRCRYARVLMNKRHFLDASHQVKESLKIFPTYNWFVHATHLQIIKNWYLSIPNEQKNIFKRKLHDVLESITEDLYKSAALLLDISDIYYYLGIDPVNKKAVDKEALERAVEHVMLARERVEGYKNVRSHARLAHCLWALENRKLAVECMKRAIELEKPGYTKNLQYLCEYLLMMYNECSQNENADHQRKTYIWEFAAALMKGYVKNLVNTEILATVIRYLNSRDYNLSSALKTAFEFMKMNHEYSEVAVMCCSLLGWPSEIQQPLDEHFWDSSGFADWEIPDIAKSNSKGWKYDFFLLHAEEDHSEAKKLLKKLETQHVEGFNYKGFFPERDGSFGVSKFATAEDGFKSSKLILVLVTSAFQKDKLCSILLDECLALVQHSTTSTSPFDVGQQPPARIVPVVAHQCQLPFGLLSVGTILHRLREGEINSSDMPRLKRILDADF